MVMVDAGEVMGMMVETRAGAGVVMGMMVETRAGAGAVVATDMILITFNRSIPIWDRKW